MDKELKKMSGVFETIRIIDLSKNTSIDYSTNSESEKRIIDTNKNASAQMDKYIEEFVCKNKISARLQETRMKRKNSKKQSIQHCLYLLRQL